jgi:cysteinyl-tRNA synthetase
MRLFYGLRQHDDLACAARRQRKAEKLEAFAFFDRVFGLGLEATGEPVLTAAQASLIEAREEARRRKDWSTADRLRAELLAQGIGLRDGTAGPEWDISPDASG